MGVQGHQTVVGIVTLSVKKIEKDPQKSNVCYIAGETIQCDPLREKGKAQERATYVAGGTMQNQVATD